MYENWCGKMEVYGIFSRYPGKLSANSANSTSLHHHMAPFHQPRLATMMYCMKKHSKRGTGYIKFSHAMINYLAVNTRCAC